MNRITLDNRAFNVYRNNERLHFGASLAVVLVSEVALFGIIKVALIGDLNTHYTLCLSPLSARNLQQFVDAAPDRSKNGVVILALDPNNTDPVVTFTRKD
jgi:hypothetical protein